MIDDFEAVPAGTIAAVVTVLEMRSAAPARPVPAGVPGTLRLADRPDTERYLDLYRRVGEPHLWYSRLAMPRAALGALLGDERVALWTLEVDGREEGLVEIDYRTEGAAEIAFFGVTPALVGTGAARLMMNHAIAEAFRRPVTRLWLHTNSIDHPRALHFYRRSGFLAVARFIERAPDPRLSGLLPREAAPDVPIL